MFQNFLKESEKIITSEKYSYLFQHLYYDNSISEFHIYFDDKKYNAKFTFEEKEIYREIENLLKINSAPSKIIVNYQVYILIYPYMCHCCVKKSNVPKHDLKYELDINSFKKEKKISYVKPKYEKMCSVCLTDEKKSKLQKLKCGHYLHSKCEREAVKANAGIKSCPMCRNSNIH